MSVHVHDGALGQARSFRLSRDVCVLATPALVHGASDSDSEVRLGVWPRTADSAIEYRDPRRTCPRVRGGAEVFLEGKGPAFVAMVAAAQGKDVPTKLITDASAATTPHPSAPDDWTIHASVVDGRLLSFALARPRLPGRARARFLFHRTPPGAAAMVVCLQGRARVESSDAPAWAHDLTRDRGIAMPHQLRPCVADAEEGTLLLIAVVDLDEQP